MLLFRRIMKSSKQLDALDPSIVIRGVDPGRAQENIQAADRMGGWGQRVTAAHWQPLEASVTYAINIPKNKMKKRREVFDMVNAWAKGPGYIKMTESVGNRRLYVDKVILPNSGDLWNWNAEYTIVFRAYSIPFWEESEETFSPVETASPKKINKTGSVTIEMPGTAQSVIDLEFANISGKTINDISIQVNRNAAMTFTGINLAATETLRISHTADGLIRCRANNRDVYRFQGGADDLVVDAGTNEITVTATRAGELRVHGRGRWL